MGIEQPTTYIKLDRKILVWEWYKNAVVKSMFLHLLLLAEHHDKKVEGITLNRGQIKATLKQLSEGSGLSVQQVRTALNKLVKTEEIYVSSKPQGTIITVRNYNVYQAPKITNNQQTANKPSTNLPYIKKDNKDKKESSVEDEEWVFQ